MMTETDQPVHHIQADVVFMRMVASDIRRFVDMYGDEIPNNTVATNATAVLIDVIADRIERKHNA